jgi:transcriptional regulator with XRE-family HTH domain
MGDLQATVGAVIRRMRREQGLTLRELADLAALSEVYLGEIERGQKYPSARVLEELARALESDIADMLTQVAEEIRVATPVPERQASAAASDSAPRAALDYAVQVWDAPAVALIALQAKLLQIITPGQVYAGTLIR